MSIAGRWPATSSTSTSTSASSNLPAGSRLSVGEAVLEVSEKPHRGCAKFSARFGPEALRFVNSEEGRAARLRGMNALVVRGGVVRTGDPIAKVDDGPGAA